MYTPGIGSISGAIHLFARRPFISTIIVALAITAAVVTSPAVAPPPAPPAPAAPMVLVKTPTVLVAPRATVRRGVKHNRVVDLGGVTE